MPGSGGDTRTREGTRGWGAPGGWETSEECEPPERDAELRGGDAEHRGGCARS